jgi:hypothetical protein
LRYSCTLQRAQTCEASGVGKNIPVGRVPPWSRDALEWLSGDSSQRRFLVHFCDRSSISTSLLHSMATDVALSRDGQFAYVISPKRSNVFVLESSVRSSLKDYKPKRKWPDCDDLRFPRIRLFLWHCSKTVVVLCSEQSISDQNRSEHRGCNQLKNQIE